MKILSIFGTRPEAIKMAPIVRQLERTPGVDSRVCVTAQHREMLDQVLNLFEIIPDVDLDLMQSGQTLAELTARVFTSLDSVLTDLQPDWILVQGDTTTVMAASLSAYYRRIKVGHVEAGLRTGDKWQPFPEEVNRRVASVIADLHFAPTEWSRQNLLRENVPAENIIVTGNPVIDALHWVSNQDSELSSLDVPAPDVRLVLVTAHRRENFGEPLEQICAALRDLSEKYADMQIVYPVHLNPNVQEPVYRLLGDVPNITLLPPLDYLPLVHLLKRAALVLTDSGGLQEEAPGLGIPVLVMREVTERPEGVEAGTVRLVGTDAQRILDEASRLLDDPAAHEAMSRATNPYGDGRAAERIVDAILNAEG
ncbi:MAG: UDP-N-acetylglucosamine 2-epimerase (non-hydrolyzing) [Anaerolineales bacterium]|nr:UDP-N-acetylglucosamine 2-epimerase (non-hydrolyzing) [Anaerolineales bacterium]